MKYLRRYIIELFKVRIFHSFILTECNGDITLLSNKDETEIEIKSEKLLRILRRSRRKSVKKKIKRIGMRFAKVTGDCCWKICDQYRGGEAKKLMKPHTYHSPWSIRAVKLIKC